MESPVFVGNIKSSGKGPDSVTYDHFPVIPADIAEAFRPLEGSGRPYMYPGIRQVVPEGPRCAYGAKVVIENIYLNSFPCLCLECVSHLCPCLVISKYVEMKTDKKFRLLYTFEYGSKGVFPL